MYWGASATWFSAYEVSTVISELVNDESTGSTLSSESPRILEDKDTELLKLLYKPRATSKRAQLILAIYIFLLAREPINVAMINVNVAIHVKSLIICRNLACAVRFLKGSKK